MKMRKNMVHINITYWLKSLINARALPKCTKQLTQSTRAWKEEPENDKSHTINPHTLFL